MKAAIYARYSGDRQREASIDDQVRNCTRHAEREGFSIGKVYHDKAVSGSFTARHEYQEMLTAATAGSFDILMVDDLSRLSRDEYEMKGLLRKFAWQGLRVLGVSDGYDSARKGHKIHAGFKGLMNEIFLDDLRDRTHRGMTGQALKGYNCGGRTFGYRNVPIEDPARKDVHGRPAVVAVRYEIHDTQAEIVRSIHSWYAEGYSYKWIASELNRRRISSSRGSTWAMSAVKVILDNEMYQGKVVWNRRAWVKHPDTGKRTSRERPREEWIVIDDPSLRIVPESVIGAVRMRKQRNSAKPTGGFRVSSAQRYLLSGLMSCAECGRGFVLVGTGRYGCASHWTRGEEVCSIGMTVSRHIVEDRLLRHIKAQLLEPDNLTKFKRLTTECLERQRTSNQTSELKQQLKAAEGVRENIVAAIKMGIVTPSTKQALETAESEIVNLNAQIDGAKGWEVSDVLPRAIERYQKIVQDLERSLAGHIAPAREILRSLLGETIRIHRRGEHLEAEIPNHVRALLAKTVNSRFDLAGCGGGICSESTFVSLEAQLRDSTPLKYRESPKADGRMRLAPTSDGSRSRSETA